MPPKSYDFDYAGLGVEMPLNKIPKRIRRRLLSAIDHVRWLMASRCELRSGRALDLSVLEDRVLLSAAPAVAVAAPAPATVDVAMLNPISANESSPIVVPIDAQAMGAVFVDAGGAALAGEIQLEHSPSLTLPVSDARSEVAFVDAGAADYQQFVDDLNVQRESGRNIDIVVLDATRDGIEQITEALTRYRDVDAVHIVSHATDRGVKLGSTWLTLDSLPGNAGRIANWGWALSSDADVLFYGCDLAATNDGRELLESIGALTGADVAASNDDTGSKSLGGDWQLEFRSGDVTETELFSSELQAGWDGLLNTFVVTTTADSGAGSFRQAIIDANALAGTDTITFNITGTGVKTIALTSELPDVIGTVVIDATTQTGFVATPLIELDGRLAGASASGLTLRSTTSTVRGLSIFGFAGNGVELLGDDNNLFQNFIGLRSGGTVLANSGDGVFVQSGFNQIGGLVASDRNVISGNLGYGVTLSSLAASSNVVEGNYIGTNVAGTTGLGNQLGGVQINNGQFNFIGGVAVGAGNVISGNSGSGLFVHGTTGDDNYIYGNMIGVASNGTTSLGNSGHGVSFTDGAFRNNVGDGTAAGSNTIRFNAGHGVSITNGSGSSIENSVRRNSISDNGGQGIDLGNDGIDLSDLSDVDAGPNNRQNAPVITNILTNGATTTIYGRLNSTLTTNFQIDLYSSPTADPSGYGEGQTWLGTTTVVTDSNNGDGYFQLTIATVLAPTSVVTATATEQGGDTSEFSAAIPPDSYVLLTDQSETLVNTSAANVQQTSGNNRGSTNAVAVAADGTYFVVWSEQPSAQNWKVMLRKYDSNGTALSGPIQVSAVGGTDAQWATVAVDAFGRAVVTWTKVNSGNDVYARRVHADGSMNGAEFQVNTTTTNNQQNSSVAMDLGGNFVITWEGEGTGDTTGVFARRYTANGTPVADEFLVNTVTTGTQGEPTVAMNGSGQFVIVWDDPNGVNGRRYDAFGVAQGGQFNVDGDVTSGESSVAIGSDGRFVVAWRRTTDVFYGIGVYARRYDEFGVDQGPAFVVNTDVFGDQTNPSVAMDAAGSFVVVYEGTGIADSSGVYAHRYDSSGVAQGSSFLVNSTTSGTQQMASVAMQDLDNYVVVWSGNGAGDSNGVFSRQYGAIVANQPPMITSNGGGGSASISIAENSTAVTTVTATDADLPTQTLSYSISGGVDAAKFSINGSTGALNFASAPNFEAPTDVGANNVYDVIVQVSDGSLTDTQAIVVTVTAVNDNTPTITSNGGGGSASISVAENSTAVTTVTATDADLPAQALTYSISGGADAAKFSINSSTGALSFASAPNFEAPTDVGANNVYDVIVRVSDGSLIDTQAIAVTVTDVGGTLVVTTFNDVVDGNTSSVEALLGNRGADGFISLREAILATNNTAGVDAIQLSAGTYTFTIAGQSEDLSATGDLDITDSVTIVGAGIGVSLIDANGLDRVFQVHAGTVSISDVSVRGGVVAASDWGGGVLIQNSATLNLSRVEVTSNSAGSGAGIYNYGAMTATDSIIQNNSASDWGGGLYNDRGNVTLNRVTISGNTAGKDGGGIENTGAGAVMSLVNVTLSSNTATGNGGGLWTNRAVTATNVTVAFNTAAAGDGLYGQGGGGTVSLKNSLLFNPAGSDSNKVMTSLGHNLDSDGSAGLADPTDFNNVNPLLGTLQFNGGIGATHALLSGSAAINAGTAVGTPSVDQRNVARDASPDIGAFEFIFVGNVPPTITSNGGGNSISLSVVENSTSVTTVTATDADLPAQTLTFSISGGADSAKFTINSSTGVLSFASAPNFEAPTDVGANNVYDVIVQASDGSLNDTQVISVTVTNSLAGDILVATQDTYINSASPTLNYGQSTSLVLDKSGGGIGSSRILLLFDLSDIPANATITSATLVMQATQNGGALDINVYQVTQAWQEGSGNGSAGAANWTQRQTGVNWTAAGGDFTNTVVATLNTGLTGQHTWNVTSLVADWYAANKVNNGVIIGSPNLGTTTVTYDSAEGTIAPKLLVNFNLTNAPPVITSNGGGGTAAVNVAENSTAVTTVAATDVNLPAQTLTYSISGGADTAKFSINSSTGALSFASAPNFEAPTDVGAINVYDVIVQVSDGSATDTQAIAVTVTAINETPVITSNGGGASATVSIAENSTSVTSVTATDPDLPAQTLTYSISGGADSTKFTINSSTGALSFASAPNFEAPTDVGANNVYNVIVQVGDGSLTDTQNIAVIVTNANDPPVVSLANPALAYAEQAAPLTVDSALTITDPDGGNLTGATVTIAGGSLPGPDELLFTLSGGIAGSFDAATDTLTLTGTATVADYQSVLRSVQFRNLSDTPFASTRTLTFTVTDGAASGSDSRDVMVTALNDPPTINVANPDLAFVEGNPPLVIDSGLIVSDVDNFQLTGATVRISVNFQSSEDVLSFTPSGPISGNYNAGTGVLTLTGSGTLAEYQAVLRTIAYRNTSVSPNTSPRTILFSINDGAATGTDSRIVQITAVNNAPTMNPATFSLAENSVNGAVVGAATATDPDVGDTKSFAITAGNTGGAFAINATTGQITVATSSAVNFETTPAFSLTVRVTDGGGLQDTDVVTINLTDVNEAPVITSNGAGASAAISVAENGTAVTTATATDFDVPAQSLTFTISGGADAVKFAINPTTGVLTFLAASNFETPTDVGTNNVYNVNVRVSDGTLTDTQNLAITVTNVNEAPAITSDGGGISASISLAENTTVVTTVASTDPDAGATRTFTISGGADASLFTINGSSGRLSFLAARNFESPADVGGNNVYDVTVQVSDGTLTDSQDIAVAITNVNESPAQNPATFSIAENSANGTLVGLATATDPDAGDTRTFAITAGNIAGAFAINASTGEITVANSAAVNFEVNPTFNLTVRVTDGSGLQDTDTVTINLTNVNESPNQNPATFSLAEGSANGTIVGNASATDPDVGDTRSFAITGGNIGGAFSINGSTGQITVANSAAVSLALNPVFSLSVQVTDGGGLQDTDTVTVNLTIVNNAPTMNPATFGLAENSANGTIVGSATATDPDIGDSLSYSFIGGNVGGAFTINSSTGQITIANSVALNFEVNPTFNLIVRATDSSNLADTATIQINLSNVNEAPVLNDASRSLGETSANGTIVTDLNAVDPDAADPCTFAILSGNVGGAFVINPLTGQITVANTLSAATNPSYSLVVQVQDSLGLTDTATVTVTVTSSAPPIIVPPPPSSGSTSGNNSNSGSTNSTSTTNTNTNNHDNDPPAPIVAPPPSSGQSANSNSSNGGGQSGANNIPTATDSKSNSDDKGNGALLVTGESLIKKTSGDRQPDFRASNSGSSSLSAKAAVETNTVETSLRDSLRFGDEDLGFLVDQQYLKELKHVQEEMGDAPITPEWVTGSAAATSAGLSIGYILWLLRSGYLVTSVLATLPMWQSVDPLPILASMNDDEDDESLDEMIDRAEERHDNQEKFDRTTNV